MRNGKVHDLSPALRQRYDGAVEIFYKTEKLAAFDSKTTHTLGLYRTPAKKQGFLYGPISTLEASINKPT